MMKRIGGALLLFVATASGVARAEPWPDTLQVKLEATVGNDGHELLLRFVLANDSPFDQQVTLRNRCLGGVAHVQGLPDNFDPLHTCQAGACLKVTAEVRVKVRAHGETEFGRTVLKADGDACNPPLPEGMFRLAVSVDDVRGEGHHSAAVPILHDRTGRLHIGPPRHRPCPACGLGCLGDTRPAEGTDENGCPLCACVPYGPAIRPSLPPHR